MDVKQYFKDYPDSKQCFQTSDGLIFHEEADARLHEKALEKKGVEKFVNGDPEVPETEPEVPETDPEVPETEPKVPDADPEVPQKDKPKGRRRKR